MASFLGRFRGSSPFYCETSLFTLLRQHGERLPQVRALYFDPYNECTNERQRVGNIDFLVRPLTLGSADRPQLCRPVDYQEDHDDFSNCDLFSLVAWDHVSWPGNDFFGGSRSTDDGVKAAATDSMAAITGVSGHYNAAAYCYRPPPQYATWGQLVDNTKPVLASHNNLLISAP